MTPLSMDLRTRIVAAYEAGEGSYSELAKRFAVSKPLVGKLVRQSRQTGSLASGVHRCGRKPLLTAEQLESLAHHILDEPDATVLERQRALNLPGCEPTIWAACKKLGANFKKKRYEQPSKIGLT